MIANCTICSQLPQRISLNYERNDARPQILDALETIKSEHRDDPESREAWSETRILRCRTCTTVYYVSRGQDTGHSFMDPTYDYESITRITPAAARRLEVDVEPAAALAPLLDHDNWHLRQYAIESLVDEWQAIDTMLAHPKLTARVEAVHDVMYLATFASVGWIHRVVTPVAVERARALAPQTLAAATSILRAPNEPTIHFMSDASSYQPTTTHTRAATAINLAVLKDLDFDDVALLLEMLRAGGGVMHYANSSLIILTRKKPNLVEQVRASLMTLPQSLRDDYNVRRLVEQVKAH